MKTYDLYGFLLGDINKAKETLENVLSIKFEGRDSSYHGEYFKWNEECSDENLILKHNIDTIDEEPVEMTFAEYPILLYVNNTLRSVDLQGVIAQKAKEFILLRHEKL